MGTGVVVAIWLILVRLEIGDERLELRSGQTKMAALPPIITAHERIFIGDQIAQMHAGVPCETTWIGNVAAQRDCFLIRRQDGEDAQDIPARDSGRQSACVQGKLHCLTNLMIPYAFERNAGARGQRGGLARSIDEIADGFAGPQLVDAWSMHASCNRDLRSGSGNENDVFW